MANVVGSMGKVQDKASQEAPVAPEKKYVIFISNDEDHMIVFEPQRVDVVGGVPERVEAKIVHFKERTLRVPEDATIVLRSKGKHPVSLVQVLREYHRFGIDYQEAANLDGVHDTTGTYVDKLAEMSLDNVKTEAARLGVHVGSGDTKEQVILNILRKK